jgi:site-specific recombinase XerD
MNPHFTPYRDGTFGPLSPHIHRYLDEIREQGFASLSRYEQVHVLAMFGCWLERKGHCVGAINEAVIIDFQNHHLKSGYGSNAGAATLRRLLVMLRKIGVIMAAEEAHASPSEQLAKAYNRYLLEKRNLSCHSVASLLRFVLRFLSEKFNGRQPDLSAINACDVTEFVRRHARRHGPHNARDLVKAMRSFLRYLYSEGLVEADLSLAVPKVARWSFSTLPKHLAAAQVRQVLLACDRSTPLGRRNYAILLLLARLGLRAGEVMGLNLEDIDWDNARITVRGKGGRWSQLPLPADTARALASHLRHGRPHCACRRVFLRDRAPIGGFQNSTSISKIVQCALKNAGVESVRKGAHLLRHSLATEMLRKGASLEEIGELLRHRSPDTTAIYAKVDIGSLRELALAWPGGAR